MPTKIMIHYLYSRMNDAPIWAFFFSFGMLFAISDLPFCYAFSTSLIARFDKAKARHTAVTDLIAERTARKHRIETYLKEL